MIFEKKNISSVLKIAISEKEDGEMNISSFKNIQAFLQRSGMGQDFCDMAQYHGKKIVDAKKNSRGEGDGLVTKDHAVLIVRVADCLPVVLFDPQKEILMLLHCGYKGIRDGILEEAIETLKRRDSSLSAVFVFLGPGICKNCYEVNRDRYIEFKVKQPSASFATNNRYFIDIRKAVTDTLITHGILASNMKQLERCTKEDAAFFSYRNGDIEERFVVAAQIQHV